MKEENFEEIIKNDESLNKLLNQKDVSVFSNFSNSNFKNEDFKKHINEAYRTSYKEVFDKSFGTSEEGKVTTLFRSVEFLATPEFKEEICNDLEKIITAALINIDTYKNTLQSKPSDVNMPNHYKKFINALNIVNIDILNRFDDNEKIKTIKNQILTSVFDICDILSQLPDNTAYKMNTYNLILEKVQKIKDLGNQKERFEIHKQKEKTKNIGMQVKLFAGLALVILFAIIRILITFLRH
ncbi:MULTISPECIES: hypothetical protein [Flavobacterium]|uniref:Transmembrane protein n=1 Tax=Flavobacterium jumunjinense TaxID=998845 RepID=A0ABV5GU16_9FLAO|nr:MULTISPECIES: hypothetical protein [Flavobacterium]